MSYCLLGYKGLHVVTRLWRLCGTVVGVVGVRQQSVFLGSARFFWRFLLNLKWENIKKNRTAFSFSEHLYSSEKRQRQLYCREKTTATFVSSQIDDRWIGKWATKPHQNPPWKASPMWPGFKSRRLLQTWVEFAVGSLPCFERFFSGYSGFPFSSKTNTSKFQFYLERTDTFKRVYKNS